MKLKLIAALLAFSAVTAQAACSPSDFKVELVKWGFKNSCRTRTCFHMVGVANVTNSCKQAAGFEAKYTAWDKAGNPVAVKQFTWPFSINNIAPGKHTFSLDQVFDHDEDIASISVQVVSVKTW